MAERRNSLQQRYNQLVGMYKAELARKEPEVRKIYMAHPNLEAKCKCGSPIFDHTICQYNRDECHNLVCPRDWPKVCRSVVCVQHNAFWDTYFPPKKPVECAIDSWAL